MASGLGRTAAREGFAFTVVVPAGKAGGTRRGVFGLATSDVLYR